MSRVLIEVPAGYGPERNYIARVLFEEFLGLEWEMRETEEAEVHLRVPGLAGELVLPDRLFRTPTGDWLLPRSLPACPLPVWDARELGMPVGLVDSRVPVVYGDSAPRLELSDGFVRLPLDVFGTAFFLLTRYEEAVLGDSDAHGRFPATASLAYRAGFLDRPLVNEYLEILWAAMKRLWPGLQRKSREARTVPTCDVDWPYSPGAKSFGAGVRQAVGEVVKNRNFAGGLRSLANAVASRVGYHALDPFDTFDWIMDLNEAAGNRVVFYFIAGHSAGRIDGIYDLTEPRIRALIKRIHERGHEIGLHLSYNTFQDAALTSKEAMVLRGVMAEEHISQAEVGSRQHFLRWRTPATARNLEQAGIAHDSTLGFADCAGFRCGTCFEYPFYDVEHRRPLKLRERPLIVMERSVMARNYMGLGYSDAALEMMKRLQGRCRQFGGDFVLLWHNSHLTSSKDRLFYRELVHELT